MNGDTVKMTSYHPFPSWMFAPLDRIIMKEPQPSKIRVTLSRPLTWAEYEHLENVLVVGGSVDKISRDSVGRFSVLHFTGVLDSRLLFEVVADVLASEFVNVFPRSVYTQKEFSV